MGLLKGLNPILTADLLHVLRSMGHGDRICVCDCNFPASRTAMKTTSQKHIILTVSSLPNVLDAICSVLPLDYFEDSQAYYMTPQDGVQMPVEGAEVINACKASIRASVSTDTVVSSSSLPSTDSAMMDDVEDVCIQPIERSAFYLEAETCFAIVQTLERRPYGNFILTKGCVGPDGNDLRP